MPSANKRGARPCRITATQPARKNLCSMGKLLLEQAESAGAVWEGEKQGHLYAKSQQSYSKREKVRPRQKGDRPRFQRLVSGRSVCRLSPGHPLKAGPKQHLEQVQAFGHQPSSAPSRGFPSSASS